MRLAKERITHIAKALTRRLAQGGYIEPQIPAEELTGRIDQIITEEFMIEDRLNKEVAELLKAHEKEIEKGNIDYNTMFSMIKKKLVKEKGIIL